MATTTVSGLARAGDSVRRLQAEVERLIYRVRAEVTDFASDESRPWIRLLAEARRVRDDLRQRAGSAAQSAEKRTEDVMNQVEARIAKAIQPLATRLDVASREELLELRQRVNEIEKRLHDLSKPAQAA